MKVILCEDVAKVGAQGEVKDVSDGFARNFLLPKALALLATSANIRKWNSDEKNREVRASKNLEAAQALADKLSGFELELPARAGKEGHLFGSVTSSAVADAISEKGISIDRRNIVLDAPIKTLGEYQVQVHLHSQVTASLKIRVVASNEPE